VLHAQPPPALALLLLPGLKLINVDSRRRTRLLPHSGQREGAATWAKARCSS
jgi:hypothetical protein